MARLNRRGEASPDRARRTAALVDGGWVLPWGLGRQVDHASVAFVPRLDGEGLENRTGRRWTPVGPVGGPAAAVDPAGLVTPRLGGWSIDWWVGADDRWRLPSREAAVRQELVGSTPVVETAMRVPGGDAVHRCYGVPGFVVVEVENRSPAPFALALAIRPYDPLGATAAGTVAVEGQRVLVDGRTALVLQARPGRVALSTGASGDVAAAVLAGGATGRDGGSLTCPEGLATVAVIVPVAHRATVRALVPLDGPDGEVGDVPPAAAVVRGWQAQGRSGLRAEIPDARLQRAFDTARRSLLLESPDEPRPAEEVALSVAALCRLGRHTEADDLVRALWSRQRTDGSFDEPGGRGAPGGPHLWALGEHLRLRPDADLARTLDRGMVAAEGWLREMEAGDRLSWPAQRWAVQGRWMAAVAAGEAGLAVAASSLLRGASAARGGLPNLTPAPTAHSALSMSGAGDHPPVTARPAGLDVRATIEAAAGEVSGRDAGVQPRLTWLLEVGAPTWSWPDHVHPRTGAGSAGSGASRVARAGFLLLVHDLLVTEAFPGTAILVPVLPERWRGQGLEVNDAVLTGGVHLSFAVRWHGARPALLWEADGPVQLAAPGLDPSFETAERRGEALLSPPTSTTGPGGGTVEIT